MVWYWQQLSTPTEPTGHVLGTKGSAAACEKGREGLGGGAGNLDHNTTLPAATVIVTPLPSGRGHDMLVASIAGPCVHSIMITILGQGKVRNDIDVVPCPRVIGSEEP